MAHGPPDIEDGSVQSPVSSRLDMLSSTWPGSPTRSLAGPAPKVESIIIPLPVCKSSTSLPRARTSFYGSDCSPRAAWPVLSPKADSSTASLIPHLTPPSWWVCATPEWIAAAVPVAVLCAAAGCWFGISGLTATCWYGAFFAALAVAVMLLMVLHFAFSTQRLLQHISQNLAAVLAVEHGHVDEVALDRRVKFLQHALQADRIEAVVPRDPLDFLQVELRTLPDGPEGYIVTNTTGIILWANPALLNYFGYTEDELIHENVRMLMPNPYSAQHDYFMRKHVELGQNCVLGKSREVPVVDKAGNQSVVMMGLDDRIDPSEKANRVFLARMEFNSEDALVMKARLKMASTTPVTDALKVLEGVPEAVVASNAQGIIVFANKKAYDLFQWPDEALLGENVRVLMAEPFASAHDGFVQAYQTRAENAQYQGASWPFSRIVGSGRDVMAMAKSGAPVRVFLMVMRLDRPSGRPQQCVFVAKMVHIIQEVEANAVPAVKPSSSIGCGGGAVSPRLQRCPTTLTVHTADTNPHAANHDVVVRRFMPRRCTIVALAVDGLGSAVDPIALHRDFNNVIGLVMFHCNRHRGCLHWVVGTQMFVTFNLSSMPNMCHRTSAAAFVLQLQQAFANASLAQRCTLRMAAVLADSFCGQWGANQLLTGSPLQCAGILLCAQREGRVKNPVIDGGLYEELQFSFSCRRVNRAVLTTGGATSRVLDVFELLDVREVSKDEWIWELPAADQPQAHWSLAWTHLPLAVDPTLLGTTLQDPQQSSVAEACRLIQRHLEHNPTDTTALWLLATLQQQCQPLGGQRQCGPLLYRLQFDSMASTRLAACKAQTCWDDAPSATD